MNKCSDSWLVAIRDFRDSPPRSRLHPPVWEIGLENSYPVTAAQLLPIFTGFLDSHANFLQIAKNCANFRWNAEPRARVFCRGRAWMWLPKGLVIRFGREPSTSQVFDLLHARPVKSATTGGLSFLMQRYSLTGIVASRADTPPRHGTCSRRRFPLPEPIFANRWALPTLTPGLSARSRTVVGDDAQAARVSRCLA